MWPSRVVVDAPLLDDNLGFPEAVEDLANEAFTRSLLYENTPYKQMCTALRY